MRVDYGGVKVGGGLYLGSDSPLVYTGYAANILGTCRKFEADVWGTAITSTTHADAGKTRMRVFVDGQSWWLPTWEPETWAHVTLAPISLIGRTASLLRIESSVDLSSYQLRLRNILFTA